MPGPSNNKWKGKSRGRTQRRSTSGTLPKSRPDAVVTKAESQTDDVHIPHTYRPRDLSSEQSSSSTPSLKTPPPIPPTDLQGSLKQPPSCLDDHVPEKVQKVMLQEPFIHDPGNGPRVRDAKAFIGSFFAQPPTLDDPMCAEFGQEEVLQMLCTVLPEELALILWYNKSRSNSRVCPACQRLYRLGDALPNLLDDLPTENKPTLPQLLQEQTISGLCSPVCFIMASFNYPSAIKLAWGQMADEMDDMTWDMLNGPEEGPTQAEESRNLTMLVKMTRLHDLGLAQLCFDPDEALELEAAGSA